MSWVQRYSYHNVADKLLIPFAAAGGIAGAAYPIATATRQEPFSECVMSTLFSTFLGSGAGAVTAFFHPFVVTSLVFGGPLWIYQRLRFPSPEEIEVRKAKEKLAVTLAAQDVLAKEWGTSSNRPAELK